MPYCYAESASKFTSTQLTDVLDTLSRSDAASGWSQLAHAQLQSWRDTIPLLQNALRDSRLSLNALGIVLEYRLPRREKRLDCALISSNVVVIIEFKAGAHSLGDVAATQAVDYGLDIHNYHEESRNKRIHVIVCSTNPVPYEDWTHRTTKLASLILLGPDRLASELIRILHEAEIANVDKLAQSWARSRYLPIPGILESINILFTSSIPEDIKSCLASSEELEIVVDHVIHLVKSSYKTGGHLLLLITGTPGSGKTLVGLKLAHTTLAEGDSGFVYMSGNGPLLKVLRESLKRNYMKNLKLTADLAKEHSEALLHSVHAFIEESQKSGKEPSERIVIFDEAQRAWNKEKMQKMNERQRKYNSQYGDVRFDADVKSEPETLLSIMNRRKSGSVIVALCGNGQEIHDGEAGITEWIEASKNYTNWQVLSGNAVNGQAVQIDSQLHLSVPMRSQRAKAHARWVDHVLSGNVTAASSLVDHSVFPIFITRSLEYARDFLDSCICGDRRFGLLASSGAARLRAYGIEVSADFRGGVDYPLWFTGERDDFRSSYSLEFAATEFEVQGLEIDWPVVAWSWDLLPSIEGIECQALKGRKWKAVEDQIKKTFAANKYRVLLTRAREGMIIFVPKGSRHDPTRPEKEMDNTHKYLIDCGCRPIPIVMKK